MVALDGSSEHVEAVAECGRASLNNLKHHSQHFINLSKPIVYTSFKAFLVFRQKSLVHVSMRNERPQ